MILHLVFVAAAGATAPASAPQTAAAPSSVSPAPAAPAAATAPEPLVSTLEVRAPLESMRAVLSDVRNLPRLLPQLFGPSAPKIEVEVAP